MARGARSEAGPLLAGRVNDSRATSIAYPNRLWVNRRRPIHPQRIADGSDLHAKTAAPYGAAVGRLGLDSRAEARRWTYRNGGSNPTLVCHGYSGQHSNRR